MEKERSISIEVVYARPASVFLRTLTMPAGTTVAQAIAQSGFASEFPRVEITEFNVGVFSQKVRLGHELADGDRVEIYRPLQLTPNEARKLRATRKRPNIVNRRPKRTGPG